jgi:DNA-binding response OmpR family regulator
VKSTILIAEDDRKIAAAIKLYLEREGYAVFIAENGRDALREARARQPALIILDLMLPQLSGVDVCRILRAESEIYIIMLTARTTEEDKLRGLDLGADDYVTKPFSPRELLARVRAVLRRQRTELTGPTEIRINGLLMNLERHEVSLNENPVYLTAAEFRLLETLIRAPERVFTRQELVERAFGDDYDGLERTIDAHIMNLRKKIETDRTQPSLIVTVYGVGYKFSTGLAPLAPSRRGVWGEVRRD